MKYSFFIFLFLITISLQAQKSVLPSGTFDSNTVPSPPDYSKADYWAALPEMRDMADETPKGLIDGQDSALADVFFVHPTTYTRVNGNDQWNASLDDTKLNSKTDNSTIKYQASAFNAAGRVFAPRYRQAHIYCYFTKKTESAEKAFELAYSDVKTAFEYYLKNYNNGRPIILASHSQGTNHSERLIIEYFDGKDLEKQLVVAYLVGMPVAKDTFKLIKPCRTPDETGCFCSWRTFVNGYTPSWDENLDSAEIAVTNPITWSEAEPYGSYEMNKGSVLKKFKKVRTGTVDAEVSDNVLWINKLKVFGAALVKMKNYHVADINLFYVSIRENAKKRVEAFLGLDNKTPGSTRNEQLDGTSGNRE